MRDWTQALVRLELRRHEERCGNFATDVELRPGLLEQTQFISTTELALPNALRRRVLKPCGKI